MELLNIRDLPDNLKGKQPIVFFDGDCSLCSSSVRFLLKHNNTGNLYFASLQSEAAMTILKLAGKGIQQSDTLLFVESNILYSYSTAALKITAYLTYPWRLLGIFILIPSGLRDYIYRLIAGNRYKWFGRKSFCTTGAPEIEGRFLS